MTQNEVTENCIRAVNGGQYNTDNKYDPRYIESLVPKIREQAIILSYNGGKVPNSGTIIKGNASVSGDWLQTTDYIVDTAIQDPDWDYLLFEALPIIRINTIVDGANYGGVKDEAFNFCGAKTVGAVASLKKLNFFKNGKWIVLVRVGQHIRAYGNKQLTGFQEQAIYQRPELVSGFNPNTTYYPINEGLLPYMKLFLFQEMGIEIRSPKDNVADRSSVNLIA